MATRIAEPDYIVQRRTRINGEQYEPGDPAPEGIGNVKRLVKLGILAAVQPGTNANLSTATQRWDPEGSTVEEALAFVLAHPDQLARIREAEKNGQARKTLLAELKGSGPAAPDPDPSLEVLPPPADPWTPSTALRAHLADVQGTLGAPEESGSASAGAGASGLNPADHPVAEVIGYVDANPDQAEDLLAAERAGKNRTTLTRHLEDVLAAQDAEDPEPAEDQPDPEPVTKPLDPRSPGPSTEGK